MVRDPRCDGGGFAGKVSFDRVATARESLVGRWVLYSKLGLPPQSYGPRDWAGSHWLLPHVLCGLVAISIGPLQLLGRIRKSHVQVHRWSGREYLQCGGPFVHYVSKRVSLVEGFGCPNSQFCLYEVFDDFNGTARGFRRDFPGAANYQSMLFSRYLRSLGGAASFDTRDRLREIADGN